jgi:hypothetical protein
VRSFSAKNGRITKSAQADLVSPFRKGPGTPHEPSEWAVSHAVIFRNRLVAPWFLSGEAAGAEQPQTKHPGNSPSAPHPFITTPRSETICVQEFSRALHVSAPSRMTKRMMRNRAPSSRWRQRGNPLTARGQVETLGRAKITATIVTIGCACSTAVGDSANLLWRSATWDGRRASR